MKSLLAIAIAGLSIGMAGLAVSQPGEVAQQRGQVIIYTKDNCPPCNRLKDDLEKHYKVESKKEPGRFVFIVGWEKDSLFRLVKTNGSAPVIVYPNGRKIEGYVVSHKTLVNWHPQRERIKKR